MALFNKKSNTEKQEESKTKLEYTNKWHLKLVSTEYYGHGDIEISSTDKKAIEDYYNTIKVNIGKDFIIELIADSDHEEVRTINLKNYAYVSFYKTVIQVEVD